MKNNNKYYNNILKIYLFWNIKKDINEISFIRYLK